MVRVVGRVFDRVDAACRLLQVPDALVIRIPHPGAVSWYVETFGRGAHAAVAVVDPDALGGIGGGLCSEERNAHPGAHLAAARDILFSLMVQRAGRSAPADVVPRIVGIKRAEDDVPAAGLLDFPAGGKNEGRVRDAVEHRVIRDGRRRGGGAHFLLINVDGLPEVEGLRVRHSHKSCGQQCKQKGGAQVAEGGIHESCHCVSSFSVFYEFVTASLRGPYLITATSMPPKILTELS